MSTPYSPQHCWMEWLVDVQVASHGCDSPVCLHASRLGTAVSVAYKGVCIGGRRCFVDCCLPPPQPTLYLLPPPPGRHYCQLPSLPAQAENGGSRRHGQVRVMREACCLERSIERLNISILVDIYLTDSLLYSI
jgi:hypothetical protein